MSFFQPAYMTHPEDAESVPSDVFATHTVRPQALNPENVPNELLDVFEDPVPEPEKGKPDPSPDDASSDFEQDPLQAQFEDLKAEVLYHLEIKGFTETGLVAIYETFLKLFEELLDEYSTKDVILKDSMLLGGEGKKSLRVLERAIHKWEKKSLTQEINPDTGGEAKTGEKRTPFHHQKMLGLLRDFERTKQYLESHSKPQKPVAKPSPLPMIVLDEPAAPQRPKTPPEEKREVPETPMMTGPKPRVMEEGVTPPRTLPAKITEEGPEETLPLEKFIQTVDENPDHEDVPKEARFQTLWLLRSLVDKVSTRAELREQILSSRQFGQQVTSAFGRSTWDTLSTGDQRWLYNEYLLQSPLDKDSVEDLMDRNMTTRDDLLAFVDHPNHKVRFRDLSHPNARKIFFTTMYTSGAGNHIAGLIAHMLSDDFKVSAWKTSAWDKGIDRREFGKNSKSSTRALKQAITDYLRETGNLDIYKELQAEIAKERKADPNLRFSVHDIDTLEGRVGNLMPKEAGVRVDAGPHTIPDHEMVDPGLFSKFTGAVMSMFTGGTEDAAPAPPVALFQDPDTDDTTEEEKKVGEPPEASSDDYGAAVDLFFHDPDEFEALDPAQATRRQLGFQQYRLAHQDARTKQIFARGLENQYFIWNDHLSEVEPNYSYAQKVVGKYAPADHKRRAQFVDRQVITAHPSVQQDERILQKENELLPFGKVHGTHAQISQFIDLKLVPKMIYIHIKRGVSEIALDLLVKRIMEHAAEAPTRILRRLKKKGKFGYRTWISTAAMKSIGEQGLFEKIVKVTRDRKRSVTIVVRQKMKDYGKVHEIWDSAFSLL